ncbi:MAG: MgtC/SapB family protein [Flavisolibacter sp.]|nr:MgtC/SapB family protein [Flavisolibacter sp.]
MFSVVDLLIDLFFVFIVGGLIGAEREYRSKSAGFRTMILICLGSFLFTTFSIAISGSTNDRIASNIVTGIGFLGAGVIFRSDNGINGITTAASIWVTAALGMGIGNGQYFLVIISTLVVLVSLFFLTRLEDKIDDINQSRNYKITSPYKEELLYQYEAIIKECGLRFKRIKQTKSGTNLTGSWLIKGSEKAHKQFVERILHDPSVKEFEF